MANPVEAILEARANAYEEAKATIDAAASEKRELSAEESEKVDKIFSDMDSMSKRAQQLVEAEERAAQADALRERYAATLSNEARNESRTEADEIRALITGERRQAVEIRALSKGTATAGGNTVATNFADEIIELVRDNSVAFSIGAKVWDVPTVNDFAVPTVTGNGAAALVSEGSQITGGTDPAFGQKVLKPSRKFAQIATVSYELANSSNVDILSFIADIVAVNTAEAFDAKAIAGTGTNEAQGIFVGASAAVTAASGSLTLDNLIALQYEVVGRNREKGVYLMKDSTALVVRQMKDTTNNYLWQPAVVAGQPDLLLGKPVFTDPNVPAIGTGLKSVAFLNPEAYGIARYNTVRIDVDNSFKFDTDQVALRVIFHADGAVINPAGAKLLVHA